MADAAQTVDIKTPNDWPEIERANLGVIIDPLVFRTAEVFLRGRAGNSSGMQAGAVPNEALLERKWEAIERNVGALCTFFDALVLEERLPMYDYASTFPSDVETGKLGLIELFNKAATNVLVQVSVQWEAYNEMKQAAINQLAAQPAIDPVLANEIVRDMSDFDWEWRPDLWRDEYEPFDPETGLVGRDSAQKVAQTYQYAGLLFSGYAQRTGSNHIIQPGRSGIYAKASLRTSQSKLERELFAELAKRLSLGARHPDGYELPEMPTFLPYLLSQEPKDARTLFDNAVKLRSSGMVRDYRHWRSNALTELEEKGKISKGLQIEITKIASAIQREFRLTDAGGENGPVTMKVSALFVEVGIGLSKVTSALGWSIDSIPGRRYRKLLHSMVSNQLEYIDPARHLRTLWTC